MTFQNQNDDFEYENDKLREEAYQKEQQIDDWRDAAADAAFEISRLIDENNSLKAVVERLHKALVIAHEDLASDCWGVTKRECKCDDCAALRGEEAKL